MTSRSDRTAIIAALLLVAATGVRLATTEAPGAGDRHAVAPAPEEPDPAKLPPPPALARLHAVVEHNLFSPARGGAPVGDASGESPTTAAGLQLVGVAISGDQRSALLRLPDHTAKAVLPGREIGGWTVSAIEKDKVILERDHLAITLPLSRGARPASTSIPSLQE